jgi:hypothetical protein
METSLVRNSLAAQEFGSDYTEPYDVRAAGVAVSLGERLGIRWHAEAAYEEHDALRVHAAPATGRYERTIPAWPISVRRLSLAFDRPTALAPFGTELRVTGELRAARFEGRDTAIAGRRPHFARAFLAAHAERPFGDSRLVLRTTLAGVTGEPAVPPQALAFLGGPTSGPGYDFAAFAAELAASQRVEWRFPVPFPSIPLGRFGEAPASATLAPFAHAVYVSRVSPLAALRRAGWYPSLGLGTMVFFDLLRFDVARGLRDGRWTFSVDLVREMWDIL